MIRTVCDRGKYIFEQSWRPVLATIIIAAALGFPAIPGSEFLGETLESEETAGNGLTLDSTTRLTAVIVDAGTGDTLHARCNVVDCYSANHFPPPGTTFNYTSRGGYFYTEGIFEVDLPCGFSVVRIGHGPEYEPVEAGINLGLNDTTIVFELGRIANMRDGGWISGDCHLHINHQGGQYGLIPANALLMGKAEDLQIVNCLDNDYFFTGSADPCSDDDCIIYMTEEFRSDIYGHMGLLGLSSEVLPFWSRWWPMTTDIADAAHQQQGAIVVSAHPVSSEDFNDWSDWPQNGIARALPVDIIEGRIDAFEVMNYNNCHAGRELELWYRMLNCGFHLPACGGTDACMNRMFTEPLGGFRTYVHMPDSAFTVHAWAAGIVAGRTFVTNGPLITSFEIDGAFPGDTLNMSGVSKSYDCSLSVLCAYPLERAEIIKNGEVVESFEFGGDGLLLDTTFTILVDESSWIAARVYGANDFWHPVGDSLFAHTNYVYICKFGMPVLVKEDAISFVSWIDDLRTIIETDGEFNDPLDSLVVIDRLETARQFYLDLAFPMSPSEWEGGDVPQLPVLMQNVPNPFNASTLIQFTIPETAVTAGVERIGVRLAIYDVSGRLIKTIFSGELPPGSYDYFWDGKCDEGRSAASGVYFSRLITPGYAQTVKMILLR
jgi:hypothetical protein